jgi:mannose-1-phosphate guanylyltransferase
MKAILLAAGLGTRLRPITENTPKCLVQIKGKPLLEIWINNLNSVGIDKILVNTHYLSNKVENFILNNNFKNIYIYNEKKLLGTAGTIFANLDFIDNQDLLLIHSDNYTLTDLNAFIDAHNKRPKSCLMTMMTFRTDDPSSCGIIETDKQNILIGFHEKVKHPPSNLANCAVYLLSSDFIKTINENYRFATDFSTEILPYFIGKIFTYEIKDFFIDIGNISSYNKANQII